LGLKPFPIKTKRPVDVCNSTGLFIIQIIPPIAGGCAIFPATIAFAAHRATF
jgi:hypothetical protein